MRDEPLNSLERTILNQYREVFPEHMILSALRQLREHVGEDLWERANVGRLTASEWDRMADACEELAAILRHRRDVSMN